MASGLTSNTALCLLEDHDGYIWIGTRDGLNRFDGANFEAYQQKFGDSTSLINNHINCLIQSKNQELWVGTAGGLSKFNIHTKRFISYQLIIDSVQYYTNYIRTIFERNENELWIGTTHGLFIFDKKNETYRHLSISQDLSSKKNGIRYIFEDSRKRIWIGTDDGLYRYEQGNFARVPLTADADKQLIVRKIVEDQNELLWLGTENHGVIVLEIKSDNIELYRTINTDNSRLTSNTVRAIFIENDSLVWIGTFDGLNILNCKTNQITHHTSSSQDVGTISQNSVREIISDSMGGIWLATYNGGLNYFNNQINYFNHNNWFTSIDKELESNIVSELIETGNDLWIGTEGGGVYRSTDGGKTIAEIVNPSNLKLLNSIQSLQYGDNKLWIGTPRSLSVYDLSSKKVVNFFHNPDNENSLLPGHVTSIYFENKEKVWIGTLGGGLQMYNSLRDSFTTFAECEGETITRLLFDSKKQLWIGTENEVLLFDTKTKQLINVLDSVKNWNANFSHVLFLAEDSDGNIWIGTHGNGLYLIRNNELYWFNTSNGLSNNSVNSFLEGEKNQYWITTNKGLSKIRLIVNDTGEVHIKSSSFSIAQGLQEMQFSADAALKSYSGKLIFGGLNGLTSFFNRDIREADFQPNLVFEELRIENQESNPGGIDSPLRKRLNDTEHLRLTFANRNFSLSFTGINYISPEKNVFRYKTEGIDNSWVELGNQSSINFTYFPIGNHEIKIQVATNSEYWGDGYRKLMVTVMPPWWKSWWAYVIYALIVGLLLTVFFLSTQRWARMKHQLAMQEFHREKENELHQLKLKFYTDVSHELRTPLTLILAPIEHLISKTDLPNRYRNHLLQIERSGYRLLQLVNQILDLRKLETGHESLQIAEGNIIRFLSEISLAFKEVAISQKIDFEFIPHKPELMLWYDRDKLEIILNNLLSNAFKFTPQGEKVQLHLNEVDGGGILEEFPGLNVKNRYLEISVRNFGKGIKSEDIKNIYGRFYSNKSTENINVPGAGVGLELTKRMIELHKGGIHVSSNEAENGIHVTVFSVYLPMNKNEYSEKELDTEFKNSEDISQYTAEFLKQEAVLLVDSEEDEEYNRNDNVEREQLLIVEDNQELRSFIKKLFVGDYDILEAENGEVAYKMGIKNDPKLIISDIMMPVMDGIELCRKLKTDIRTSHIPVILLTARTALTFKYEGIETGADDYVTKPFSARYLALRAKNIIKQRNTIQERFRRESICDPGSITVTSIDEKLLEKAVDFITENISDSSISVNKLSAHIGLSRSQFYRKIKALTNQTAVEFIRTIKLKRAASLLAQKKLSVKEIRYMVGFEDADYFRTCFKEQFGVTPSEYTQSDL
jgi:ligand-binding sensor domain-containing protein/signal transduction histidine kinase/DNA-binding response OmpR family regulator